MNVERLFTIAQAIESDLTQTNFLQILNNLQTSLNSLVQSPNNPSYQQNLAVHLQQIREQGNKSKLNSFPTLWDQTLEELGFKNLVGRKVAENINSLIKENQLTPSVALQEIQKINKDLKSRYTALVGMVNSFKALDIEPDNLESGKCEIGFLIPRTYLKNDLKQLSKEFKELHEILSIFQEITTGSRESIKVNSIASSDFGIFLDNLPVTAACFATAVERIVALYKSYLEIKKLKLDLEEKEVPDLVVAGLNEHINSMIEVNIEKIAKEIIEKNVQNKNKERKNELENELVFALNKLTNRIDRGLNIEVRIAPLVSEENEAETNQEFSDQILNATESLKFVNIGGEPILFLTEEKKEILKANLSAKDIKPKTKKKSEA